jgi:hypothetical protein
MFLGNDEIASLHRNVQEANLERRRYYEERALAQRFTISRENSFTGNKIISRAEPIELLEINNGTSDSDPPTQLMSTFSDRDNTVSPVSTLTDHPLIIPELKGTTPLLTDKSVTIMMEKKGKVGRPRGCKRVNSDPGSTIITRARAK